MFPRRRVGVWLRRAASCVLAIVALATVLAARQDPVQTARIRESNAREGWQRVPEILVALDALPGAVVADVGAGDGFFTVRLARAVGPNGRVIAEDVSHEALERLRARVAEELLANVEVVQGEAADPHLPPGALDAVLIVNAYHEMEQFPAMLDHIRKALKPGGRLVLVEPLAPKLRGESRAAQTRAHSLDAGFADRELRAAGFDVIGLRDPFIRRDREEHWLMVAVRGAEGPKAGGNLPASAGPGPGADSPLTTGTDAEIAAPELRITVDQLKVLLAAGRVIVLDVRDADSYLAGHLPGAVLTPLPDLADRLSELRSESTPVVTYCS